MGSVLLLLVVIVASFLCVRAGAIALELTGMDAEKATFQALSAFTNTGFTTREAEEVTSFPARRRIVSVLIILGYAGTVSVIAALATSLFEQNVADLLLNVAIIVVGLYLLYRLARARGITTRLGRILQRTLQARYDLQKPSLEEMLRVGEGFGVVRVVVDAGWTGVSQPLDRLGLKALKIQVLSIGRGREIIVVPSGQDVLLPGDELTCYGVEEAIAQVFRKGGREGR